jgi:anti-sigma B factor antagonist
MDHLQISIEGTKDFLVMFLRGRIDIESSPNLRDQLHVLLRRQPAPVAIAVDLSAVDYMDTSGIATLVEALKIARIGRIALNLKGLQGRLLHLFQSTGIGTLFDTDGFAKTSSSTKVY